MFNIIAIQTLLAPKDKYSEAGLSGDNKMELALRKSRHGSVMKVLNEGKLFWLQNGYEYLDGRLHKKNTALPIDFYSEKCPFITVSAIVGENGMGKSSLLELLFRLINNTSYALREGLEVQKNALHFVRDIYARVWVEDDNRLYYIEQQDNIIRIFEQNTGTDDYRFNYDNPKENAVNAQVAKDKLRKLFYTIVVNYSQYAYNTNDYMMEWDAPSNKGEITVLVEQPLP